MKTKDYIALAKKFTGVLHNEGDGVCCLTFDTVWHKEEFEKEVAKRDSQPTQE